ncbi:MAG TPA: PEF-CTERM sorting domain-containing protein [Candidatus Methanoperedens sp.]
MKRKLVMITAFFAVMASMTGIAVADPCPGANSNLWTNAPEVAFLDSSHSDVGQVRTYNIIISQNLGSTNGVPGVIEYCVKPNPGFSPGVSGTGGLTALASGQNGAAFQPDRPDTSIFFGFKRNDGDPSNLPILNQGTVAMGSADYSTGGGSLPTSEDIIFHINDPDICTAAISDSQGVPRNTCFVRHGTVTIPEFPHIALPVAAVIGLVFIVLHMKRKEK